MILAKNTYTPIPYWLMVSLTEFSSWIHTNNDIIREQDEARQRK